MNRLISQAERVYIEQGCIIGMRQDGRGLHDTRSIYIENNVLPHSHGSSRVKIADGTDILCSVKVSVTEVSDHFPTQGKIEVSADISPSCNIRMDDRRLSMIASQVSETIERHLVDSHAIDLSKLCIISGKKAWVVLIDLLILQTDGESIDACSIATNIALLSTRIPKIEAIYSESGNQGDFEISGDLSDAIPLPINQLPITITVSKIGGVLVLDGDGTEISCASTSLCFSFDIDGKCYGIDKLSSGSLHITDIKLGLEVASATAKRRITEINKFFSGINPIFEKDCLFPEIPAVRLGFLA